ncbi:hypothetical protein [Nostoc sp. LPT]|uniref:hypothetical protein n=1 Tax=Nostoc sp. LPT TaxID=2815387 RepID=UPI0025DDE013|nr:hypothetical protein [Nostoc sp. LPT]
MKILDQAFEAVRTFAPMGARVTALLARTRQAAAKGQYERYKTTTTRNDSTAMNPAGLG